VLLVLNSIGFLVGLLKFFWWSTHEADTVLLNLIWTVYNLVILGASVAVASEARQVRTSHRVTMKLSAALRTLGGRTIRCTTSDYSEGGVGLLLPVETNLEVQEKVQLTLFRGSTEYVFPAVVTGNFGLRLGLRFEEMSVQQSVDFIQCTFARADSWVIWGDKRKLDKPLTGLAEVLGLGVRGLGKLSFAIQDLITAKIVNLAKSVRNQSIQLDQKSSRKLND
jgi:cellulose synthase (UDP-forming)